MYCKDTKINAIYFCPRVLIGIDKHGVSRWRQGQRFMRKGVYVRWKIWRFRAKHILIDLFFKSVSLADWILYEKNAFKIKWMTN